MNSTLKTPLTENFLSIERRHEDLKRIADSMVKKRFADYTLTDELITTLNNVEQDFKDAKEITERNEISTELEILQKAKAKKILNEEERNILLHSHKQLLEFQSSLLEGDTEPITASPVLSEFDNGAAEEIIAKLKDLKEKSAEEKLEDFILNQDRGRYIVEIFQILTKRWGSTFSQGRTHSLVEKLESANRVRTTGGHGTGKARRRVYPSMAKYDTRKDRDGTESLVLGQVETNIRDYFINHGGPMNLNIYEFYYDEEYEGDKLILVTQNSDLPKQIPMKSIGFYKNRNLSDFMDSEFGHRMKEKYLEDYGDDESQIATLVKDASDTETFYDITRYSDKEVLTPPKSSL